MKKSIFYVLAGAVIALASCSKKDAASNGELDGTWKVTESTTETKNTNYAWDSNKKSKYMSNVTTEKEVVTGETLTVDVSSTDYTSSGTSITPKPIKKTGTTTTEVTFDKKAGTFSMKSTRNLKWSQDIEYGGTVYGTTEYTTSEETTMSGTYFLNQKSGETGKGTLVTMIIEKIDLTEKEKSSYTQKGTTTAEVEEEVTTSSMTYTGNDNAILFTIIEAAKGVLKVEETSSYIVTSKTTTTNSIGSSSQSYTTEGEVKIETTGSTTLEKQ
ncbi:MAG: hypothetical protein SNJ71_06990 [Bacteroidales bacterium]